MKSKYGLITNTNIDFFFTVFKKMNVRNFNLFRLPRIHSAGNIYINGRTGFWSEFSTPQPVVVISDINIKNLFPSDCITLYV